MQWVGMLMLCYFIGAIPFAYLISKRMGGADIRLQGSGNVGATNVLRVMGPTAAALALTGDLGKGIVAAWLGLTVGGPAMAAACAVAAVLGHCYTIFLDFKGGKGVAASGGIAFFLMPKVGLLLLGIFLLVLAFTRYVSLASITVAAIFPLAVLAMQQEMSYFWMSLALAAVVIYGHQDNIKRLRAGVEPRLTDRKKSY
ncbi:MAG TPA: glycerol-3-phosphate 1-O-acyltransferase PlsY [Syntrophomonadaceae bacterium]|nr:glycerol-3-phosphate 1-O-acyltransferase PlsY [Syntrophomonadaceae bacterium]